MAANSTKVLLDMGTGPGLENCATHQKKTIFVTADGAKVLDVKDFSELEKALGYPMYALHRGDLHSCILEQAHKLGIEIQMGALVKKYDRDLPAAILPDGSLRKADMILVADGTLLSLHNSDYWILTVGHQGTGRMPEQTCWATTWSHGRVAHRRIERSSPAVCYKINRSLRNFLILGTRQPLYGMISPTPAT